MVRSWTCRNARPCPSSAPGAATMPGTPSTSTRCARTRVPLLRSCSTSRTTPRTVPSPSARPSTAGGRPNGQTHTHRQAGSSSSEPGGRGAEQSKFAPPPQYQPQASPHHGHGGGHRHHPSPAGHGGSGHRGQQQAPRQHNHHAAPAPHARSASPQNNAPVSLCFTDGRLRFRVARVVNAHAHMQTRLTSHPYWILGQNNRQRASAVPKFGVWDEQSAASAVQGFTVQFERVKRDREVARAGGLKVPRPPPSPPRSSHRDSPFFARVRAALCTVYIRISSPVFFFFPTFQLVFLSCADV
jgi:RPM1-interacting protein 4